MNNDIKERAHRAVRMFTHEIRKRTAIRVALSLVILFLVIFQLQHIANTATWPELALVLLLYLYTLFIIGALSLELLLLAVRVVSSIAQTSRVPPKRKQDNISPEIAEIISSFRTCLETTDMTVINKQGTFSIEQRDVRPKLCIDCNMFGTMLNADEFRALIGHEFGHIACGDLRLTRAVEVLLCIPLIGVVMLYLASRKFLLSTFSGGTMGSIITMCDHMFFLLSSEAIMQLREFRADAWTITQTGNPIALCRALQTVVNGVREKCIASGMNVFEIVHIEHQLFQTHPPLMYRELYLMSYLSK